MTPEELDEARAKEAYRQWQEEGGQWTDSTDVASRAARLAREGWTPPEPEPVDPDVLAWRKWRATQSFLVEWDPQMSIAYLAGARMAREQERERAKPLVEYLKTRLHPRVTRLLAKYRGEA